LHSHFHFQPYAFNSSRRFFHFKQENKVMVHRMNRYEQLRQKLSQQPRRWLVTGAAGFIGSHLVAHLLKLNQSVVGVDNFLTGSRKNLEAVKQEVGGEVWPRFHFLEGDIREPAVCRQICENVELVLHQAALSSVPRSIARPADTHTHNVEGFLNLQLAARDADVKAFVYASSSAVYGDHPSLPKREEAIGRPLSPYALSKWINELYAELFSRCYGMSSIGLRYFNVFGPRQDPNGPYAPVIPLWIDAMIEGRAVGINGDGETSRDFCYVENVIQANLLAAYWSVKNPQPASAQVFNVAAGSCTSLNQLFYLLRDELTPRFPKLASSLPKYAPFRVGDVRHSQADIRQIQEILGYDSSHSLAEGLKEYLAWYLANPASPA
jgi:UDP-N-acetylglucosamine/UDP-N-acetylgalactosamine 4-epimerase